MSNYYESEDLKKFGDIGQHAKALADDFFKYYGSVTGTDGALSKREKALIALAVSHAQKCPYCIDAYTTQCLETGANPEQMMEAVHVAAVMQAGITLVHSVQMQNHLKKNGPLKSVVQLKVIPQPSKYDFEGELRRRSIHLPPLSVDTLQVNITKLCNQVCRHCHVDASPNRKEMLSPEGVAKCLEILERHPQITRLDITGGAPELHAGFDGFVERAVALGKHVMVRHNLTVQLDGNPQTGESKQYLPQFFARNRVEVISSLPYYQEYFTDAQRGSGVFRKSMEAMRRLNALGYGVEDSGLQLDLVYNPVGPYLPAAQAGLEADYKRELKNKFGLVFNRLFTITNMPINRFKLHLDKSGQYEAYMEKLLAAFNPAAAAGVMCRSLISVDHEGRIYDCDFNQMLELRAAGAGGKPLSIYDFDFGQTLKRRIRFDDHCLGCTAGAGSSCGGATA